jgi:PTH1 family peptidyl-tRNA hydrolase
VWSKQAGQKAAEWIVLGLGNPGDEYAGTRHNVGFEVVERLAARHGVRLGEVRFHSLLGLGEVAGVPVVLAKPLTFMNRSGRAARALLAHFALPAERLLVIVDDVALPLGSVRVRKSGSAGGHNGLRSLIEELATNTFPRIRVGIGSAPPGQLVDYVLSRFSRAERSLIEEAYETAADAVEVVLARGVETAMNLFNRRKAAE